MTPANLADTFVQLITEATESFDQLAGIVFLNRLTIQLQEHNIPIYTAEQYELIHQTSAAAQIITPMLDAEAKGYEANIIGFGKHKGKRYSEVPVEYLQWLADKQREDWRALHAYLQSNLVKHRELMSGEAGESDVPF